MAVMEYLFSVLDLTSTVVKNWFLLYQLQLQLVWTYLTSNSIIRDRALQCLLPPTVFLLITLMSTSFVINKRTTILRPMKKVLPGISWTLAATGMVLFAIISKPALWDHQCDNTPIRINPSDRAQWRTVWTSFNSQYPEEKQTEYRKRMERELDEWALRENGEGDLEEWINLSSQAIAKRDCLNQKDKLFKETWKVKREEWKGKVGRWWEESTMREWLMRSLFHTEVCRPETKKSIWVKMVRRAREFLV